MRKVAVRCWAIAISQVAIIMMMMTVMVMVMVKVGIPHAVGAAAEAAAFGVGAAAAVGDVIMIAINLAQGTGDMRTAPGAAEGPPVCLAAATRGG